MSPPERAAVLIPVTCYPLAYYLVGYVPRYTFPLSVLLFMLAGFAISMHLGVLDRPAVWRVGRGRVAKRPGPRRDHFLAVTFDRRLEIRRRREEVTDVGAKAD